MLPKSSRNKGKSQRRIRRRRVKSSRGRRRVLNKKQNSKEDILQKNEEKLVPNRVVEKTMEKMAVELGVEKNGKESIDIGANRSRERRRRMRERMRRKRPSKDLEVCKERQRSQNNDVGGEGKQSNLAFDDKSPVCDAEKTPSGEQERGEGKTKRRRHNLSTKEKLGDIKFVEEQMPTKQNTESHLKPTEAAPGRRSERKEDTEKEIQCIRKKKIMFPPPSLENQESDIIFGPYFGTRDGISTSWSFKSRSLMYNGKILDYNTIDGVDKLSQKDENISYVVDFDDGHNENWIINGFVPEFEKVLCYAIAHGEVEKEPPKRKETEFNGRKGETLPMKNDQQPQLVTCLFANNIKKVLDPTRSAMRKGSSSSSGRVLQQIANLQKTLRIFFQQGNLREQAKTLDRMIVLLRDESCDYEGAIVYQQKLLKIVKEIGSTYDQAVSHFNIGCLYRLKLNNRKKSLFHLKKSEELFKQIESGYDRMRDVNAFIRTIEKELEYERTVQLRKLCKGTSFKDYDISKKIGGIDFCRDVSRSRHGACASVFVVNLKRNSNIEAVMKIIHRKKTDSKLSQEEYDTIVKENRVCDVESIFVLDFCHHFVDKFEGILDDLEIAKETVFLIFPKAKMDLCHLISKRKQENRFPFKEFEFLKIMSQIIRGITSLHTAGVVHCDIKNDNMLISSNGDILITDFEFQKKFRSSFQIKFTRGFARGGSVKHLPPEILNTKEGDVLDYSKSDLFGVGIVAYSLLSDELPFGEVPCYERSIESYQPLPDTISKEIREFVKRIIHPDSSQRITCHEACRICLKLFEERSEKNRKKERRIQFVQVSRSPKAKKSNRGQKDGRF